MAQNFEKLFNEIYRCEDEEELNAVVNSNDLLKDPKNWVPYGGNQNNFGTFENQASNPIPALVEKIINSIDTTLLKKCLMEKIDPKEKDAPRSMKEAVEKFFKIKDGNLLELSNKELRDIATNIQLIATGEKNDHPSLTIFDNGEGQHPDDFKDTFLSLQKGNKTKIHFVQGKYNMGSTGAVVFCGELRYQLIASKKAPELTNRKDNDFGFTLVRRHPLVGDENDTYTSTWYEYFVVEQKIPRFSINELDLGLWDRKFTSGSIVKLFSYALPRGNTSSIVWDLWRSLNQYLFHPAIPFLVYEKRGYDPKTPHKMVLGNKSRLVDESANVEKIVTTNIEDEEIGSVDVEAILLKKGVNPKEFINKKAAVFTVNGQVHGFYGNSFVSDLGFPLFRDHLLVNVNCTNIKTSFRQDIIKASRDRMNEGPKNEILNEKIIKALKNNEILKELHQKWRASYIGENINNENLIKDVMEKLPFDKDLLELLKKNGDLNFLKILNKQHESKSDPGKREHEKEKQPLKSKRFPSIFKVGLKEDDSARKIKSIPVNGKGIITFETDVQDDYFFRPKDKGELVLEILKHGANKGQGGKPGLPNTVQEIFEVTKVGPTDQAIKVVFEPKKDLAVGDEVEINAKLTSPSGDLESIFWIKIVNPQVETNENKKEAKEDFPNLPLPIKVFENPPNATDKSWKDYEWTGENVVKIIKASGEVKDNIPIEAIAINMDSNALKKYFSKFKNANPEQIRVAEFTE